MDQTSRPRPLPVRLDALELSSTEAFVLGQIDGAATLDEVADSTGVPIEKVIAIACRLELLGVIERSAPEPRGRVSGRYSDVPRSAPASAPSRPGSGPLAKNLPRVEASPSSPPPSMRPTEDDACDLDAETRASIDASAAAKEPRTHYEVLGIPPAASAKELSRAYFAQAAKLHPDRFFGKRLGPYKKKLELAFRRASEAYEVLRSESGRAEYDVSLGLTRKSAEVEAAPAPVVVPPVSSPAVSSPPARPSVPVVPSMRPPPPTLRPPPPPAPAPVQKASQFPIATTSDRPPRLSQPVPLGRGLVAKAKSMSFLQEGQQALDQGDAISAANLYRLALEYADDPGSRAAAQSGLNEARSIVADTHLKKARHEEKEARWAEAVASYEKALDRRPDDPSICERLANALRQEGHDLPRATRLAELAVARMPRCAGHRKTLGLVYADGGLREKALEEMERAVELDPSDEAASKALAVLRRKR